MNKPPERLMEGKPSQRIVYIGNGYLPSYENFQKAFILEAKEPMEKKTENLTTEEAWAAMARGECIATFYLPHTIRDNVVVYWGGTEWKRTDYLCKGPYSIVPDPSKPKEVELSEVDELLIEFSEFVDEKVGGKYEPEQDLNQTDLTRLMLHFINSKFVRKP